MNKATAQSDSFMAPPAVQVWRKRAVQAAIPLTLVTLVGWVLAALRQDTDEFYRAYLLGYMWVLGFTLGPLALLMIYHGTGGDWGTVIRRPLEAAARNLWAVTLGFLPILLGVRHLYPWARPEEVARSSDLQSMAHYLNLPSFIVRALIFFAIWNGLVLWLARVSRRQDRQSGVLDVPLRTVSGFGLVVYGLTLTFASVDWVMSLTPPWSSTIYGLLYMVGQGLTGLSLAVVVLAALSRYEPMKSVVQPDQFHDQGKLMLALTMLWGWFTLSQWLIIWAGNLPDEISWYLMRSSPGWHRFATLIVLGQFFVPFFLLLSRDLKRDPRQLAKLALYLIFVRYWDLFWYIVPSFANRRNHWGYSWQYAVVPLAMLSWWLVLYFHHLGREPLLARYDDHVQLILEKGHEFEPKRA